MDSWRCEICPCALPFLALIPTFFRQQTCKNETLVNAALCCSHRFRCFWRQRSKKNESTTPTPDKSSSFAVGSFFGGTLLGMLLMLGLMVLYNCWLRRRMNGGGLSSY